MEVLFDLFQSDAVLVQIYAVCLAMPRILTMLAMTPFFGNAVNMAAKLALFVAFYLPLQPCMVHELETAGNLHNLGLMTICLLAFKECLLGLLFGLAAGLLFFAALSAGMIIDNQRGASQAQGQDILAGVENSPFGSVLFLSLVTLFFSTGAVGMFINAFFTSFSLWPVLSFLPHMTDAVMPLYFGQAVNYMVLQALLICGPFILVSLMTDISLGVVNRFAPQLNVFILSMPIKSGLCAFLIVFFISPYFSLGTELLSHMHSMLLRMSELMATGSMSFF